jgi:hypothetical protein
MEHAGMYAGEQSARDMGWLELSLLDCGVKQHQFAHANSQSCLIFVHTREGLCGWALPAEHLIVALWKKLLKNRALFCVLGGVTGPVGEGYGGFYIVFEMTHELLS